MLKSLFLDKAATYALVIILTGGASVIGTKFYSMNKEIKALQGYKDKFTACEIYYENERSVVEGLTLLIEEQNDLIDSIKEVSEENKVKADKAAIEIINAGKRPAKGSRNAEEMNQWLQNTFK